MTTWPTILRRFVLWTVVCTISAAPSFYIAATSGVDAWGMVAGVALFIVMYTLATSTRRFDRLSRRPFVRETMYVGYGLRLILSTLVLLAALGPPADYAMAPDMLAGILSVSLANLIGLSIETSSRAGTLPAPSPFVTAFVTTCVQGVILNAMVFIVMGLAYVAQRLFRQPPADDDRHRGFEVLPTAAPTAPPSP